MFPEISEEEFFEVIKAADHAIGAAIWAHAQNILRATRGNVPKLNGLIAGILVGQMHTVVCSSRKDAGEPGAGDKFMKDPGTWTRVSSVLREQCDMFREEAIKEKLGFGGMDGVKVIVVD